MMNQKQLAVALEREQTELFSRIQTEFWQGLFCDILAKHSFQNDFFLVIANLTHNDVVEHIRQFGIVLSQKYDLQFSETSHPFRTEFKLCFPYYERKDKNYVEFSIVVCLTDITMRMLPHCPLIKVIENLEDYVFVENIITDFFEQIFDVRIEFNKFQEECRKIESASEGLNIKTIEIAQSSIRALYEASSQQFCSLVQENLYSSMLINGKNIRIYHREFLADPTVLQKELNKT